MEIKTKEDWWMVLEKNWENIFDMIMSYHPLSRNYRIDTMEITASSAEVACETVRRQISASHHPMSVEQRIKEYKKDKNPEMASLLNETWFGIPESTEARFLPSFGALCDLCSERWVFDGVDEKYLDKE